MENKHEKYKHAAKSVYLSCDKAGKRVNFIAAQIKQKALIKLSECSYFSLVG